MDTKLTLKLNGDIIEKAKEYAKEKKISLSELIENYLQKVTNEKKNTKTITPLVKSLSGVISLPKDHSHKKEYADYLSNKYK
jgi:metal-responsive CopG/Arc/MetJ family transcriptional regulator